MNIQHKNLALGRWNKLTLVEQMANVGSEINRAISWRDKGNKEYSLAASDRALELLDFTLADNKNKGRLTEIARVREVLVDFFYGQNIYHSTSESWQKYFYAFNYAARV